MSLKTYRDLEQGSDEWRQARCGILTASVMGQMITRSTMKPAQNDTARGLTTQLVAERITGAVEETYASFDMQRGTMLEPYARDIYAENYEPVEEIGFMVRTSKTGCALGYSPDGLTKEGLLEIKSPKAKTHIRTLIADEVPAHHLPQLHTGMLVADRPHIDFVSYCPAHPFFVKRVHRDETWDKVIVSALEHFETEAGRLIGAYMDAAKGRPSTEQVEIFGDGEIVI